MTVTNRLYQKLILPRVGPRSVDVLLSRWCGQSARRWRTWATVVLLLSGWKQSWIRLVFVPQGLPNSLDNYLIKDQYLQALRELGWEDGYQLDGGDPAPPWPTESERPSPLLSLLMPDILQLPDTTRHRLTKDLAVLTLRSQGWYLHWIGLTVNHPKGHLPRLLRATIARVQHQLESMVNDDTE